MPKLYRPHIPLEVRCRVVLRQLGELWIDEVIAQWKPEPSDAYLKGIGVFVPRLGLAKLLEGRLAALADLLDCKPEDLRLDHDPALATRQRKGEGKHTTYMPAANNPEFLIYREKHAHHIKTNVRGDGAQHPDRVLIKRERRRRDGKKAKPRFTFAGNKSKPKMKSRSQWPPKGSRKISNRRKP